MCTIKPFGVGQEGIQAGLGTEENGFAAILGAWKILRIGVNHTLTDCMESLRTCDWDVCCWHMSNYLQLFLSFFRFRIFIDILFYSHRIIVRLTHSYFALLCAHYPLELSIQPDFIRFLGKKNKTALFLQFDGHRDSPIR